MDTGAYKENGRAHPGPVCQAIGECLRGQTNMVVMGATLAAAVILLVWMQLHARETCFFI